MNKKLELTNLGGLPLTQDILKYMQESYRDAFAGIAAMCGDKAILTGVVNTGGTVSNGWISYGGELIPFIGGAVGIDVVITEVATPLTFEDLTVPNVYFTKTATCGTGGVVSFPFAELVPIHAIMNMWVPGDIKEKYIAPASFAAWLTANIDGSGYGLNREAGWRLLSAAVPDAEGKMFVNYKAGDADFGTIAATGGSKTVTLVQNQLPATLNLKVQLVQHTASAATFGVTDGPLGGIPNPTNVPMTNTGGGQPVDKLNPFFVIIKLIKL